MVAKIDDKVYVLSIIKIYCYFLSYCYILLFTVTFIVTVVPLKVELLEVTKVM